MSSSAIGQHLSRLKDPKFYLETYTKIKGKTPGLVPFVLTEAQKDLFNSLRKFSRVIALKARQIGFSTAVAGYLYHKTITNPGTNTALVAHKAEVATEFLDKIKLFYRSTPEELRPQIHFNSKYEMSFPALDSKIMVMSGDNVGRGFTIHNVLASELAMWDKADEMMLALQNAVPRDGQIIVESTPKGVGNLFHRMWMDEKNGYEKKKYGWWWHYTEEEIEEIRRSMSPMQFAQEYELQFLTSGRPVFDPGIVKRLQLKVLRVGDAHKDELGETDFVTEREDGLIMYRKPRPGRVYVAGVDVSEGVTGGDYSTCVIFDRSTGEEVAFYRGHVSPERFGAKLNAWGRFYNLALMVVEINNHGLTTITALKNLMYPQLYFRPAKFDTMGTEWGDRLGWKTTKVTRPLMIDDLHEALREESVTLHSEETIKEMLVFVFDDGGNMVCMSGYHDDCIFATAIAVQGFKVMYKGELTQIRYEDHLPYNSPY